MDTTDEDNTLDHSQSRGDKSSSDGDKSKGSQDSLDKAENTLAEKLRTLHSRVMQHIHQVSVGLWSEGVVVDWSVFGE